MLARSPAEHPTFAKRHPFIHQAKERSLKYGKEQIVFPTLMATLSIAFGLWFGLVATFKAGLLTFVCAAIAAFLLNFLFNLVRAPLLTITQQADEIAALKRVVAGFSAEKEAARDLYPQIAVEMKEVHLDANDRSADCFVHFTAHNSSRETPTLIQDYRMILTISGEQHEGYLAKPAQLAHYEVVTRTRVTGAASRHRDWGHIMMIEALVDIRSNIESPLETGEHVSGWLRFRFQDLPEWPEGEPLLRNVHEVFNEITSEVEEVQEFEAVYFATTATAVQMILKDSYGREHSQLVNLPHCDPARTVRKERQPGSPQPYPEDV